MEQNNNSTDIKEYSKELAILPLRDIVIYPGMIVPLSVGREKSIKLINEVMEDNKTGLL
ncbi:MAG: LON peptidase substrate-binding domain-containing protein [Candidatus Sericytochromatia bacterium]